MAHRVAVKGMKREGNGLLLAEVGGSTLVMLLLMTDDDDC
jgi:hypothetical protein